MSNLSYIGLLVLLSSILANASSQRDPCLAGMRYLFKRNTKKACYGFSKGNMTEAGLEGLCSVKGGRFSADKCSTTKSVLSANCGTSLQAITSSCQVRYPELKYPYCVDDGCYLEMMSRFNNDIEATCDEILDDDDDGMTVQRYTSYLSSGCRSEAAKVKSVCQCVRPRERKMEYDEKLCLGSIQAQFGQDTDAACYQMLTDSQILATYKSSFVDGCGEDDEMIRMACKWSNKLLGYSKCLDKSCYRGLTETFSPEQIPDICSAMRDGTLTQRELKARPNLARKCGGRLEELQSACFCLYPAERYPQCGHDDCFRGLASDWGEDIEKNCGAVLTRNFTDQSEPECKNELEGLIQESKWLGLRTYAYDQCGKSQAKLENACRCVLGKMEETKAVNSTATAVVSMSSVVTTTTTTITTTMPTAAATTTRRPPYRPRKKSWSSTITTTTAAHTSSTSSRRTSSFGLFTKPALTTKTTSPEAFAFVSATSASAYTSASASSASPSSSVAWESTEVEATGYDGRKSAKDDSKAPVSPAVVPDPVPDPNPFLKTATTVPNDTLRAWNKSRETQKVEKEDAPIDESRTSSTQPIDVYPGKVEEYDDPLVCDM
ncbi:hypothetical protein XA68_15513 [Ophiocordyceps unilateralis]|uniref:Extracellular membrane protein CFEM domain-containing protein n=1 Tax=Ophiocordyceps unilateralis TaxID=268505 RepID=A0A2A9P6F6_OPHUN|nr:hypothetical protein XA68_15513 [Ophiocordyceps unilateralis]